MSQIACLADGSVQQSNVRQLSEEVKTSFKVISGSLPLLLPSFRLCLISAALITQRRDMPILGARSYNGQSRAILLLCTTDRGRDRATIGYNMLINCGLRR